MIGGFISLSPTLSGWWYTYLLWKIWVRQLGSLFPIMMGNIIQMFETTNQLHYWSWFAPFQTTLSIFVGGPQDSASRQPVSLRQKNPFICLQLDPWLSTRSDAQICKWASDMLQICFTPPVFAWACWWITLFDDQLYTNLWSWDERKTRFRASTRMGPPPQWFARRFQAQRDLGTIWNVNPTYPKILEYLLIKSPRWRLKTTTLKHPTTQSPISE